MLARDSLKELDGSMHRTRSKVVITNWCKNMLRITKPNNPSLQSFHSRR
jgi:hypothetical protein